MIKLGVAGRILGNSQVSQAKPSELSRWLVYLQQVVQYLAKHQIAAYRLAPEIAPATEAELAAHADLLVLVGAQARQAGVRLSVHMPLRYTLSSADSAHANMAIQAITVQARLLDALNAGPLGVIVVHVGGAGGDPALALHRFATHYERLPIAARARVVVELDEGSFQLGQLLYLHQQVGVPLVFDLLHWQLNNPEQIPLGQALGLILATWPTHVRPKIHISTQRTEAHVLTEKGQLRIVAPQAGQHADFLNPHEFLLLLQAAVGLPSFDVMLEAKAGDLALLRLRHDLQRYAPNWAQKVL
jgi:UV DNA damage endonuclease